VRSVGLRIRSDERGAAVVEFAIIAPVFLLLVLSGLDLCHTMYVRSVLVGEMQKAGRDVSLEDASATDRQAAIRTRVESAIRNVMPSATVAFNYKSYHDYGDVARPKEEFNDANHNGTCDNGEGFVDANRDKTWDVDNGTDGRGGAKDVVVLTATASYDRLPLAFLLGGAAKREVSAKTLLRNQPSDQQADLPTGVCA
jgi:Flp pilus assembly protein TadG